MRGVALLLSDVRAPRLRILANGVTFQGALEAEVISNNYYGADRYFVTLAADADVATGLGYWASETDILLEVQASTDGGSSFTSLIVGSVDNVEMDPVRRIVHLEGRDLSARLIEAKTQETFANQTSSEIAELLASRHNLRASVTSTTTPVGRYYESEHDQLTLNAFSRETTEWDLLVLLAQREGFDVFVSGTALYFQPPIFSGNIAVPLSISDFVDIRFERSLTLARDIQVTVKSWNSWQQSALTQTASSAAFEADVGESLTYILVRPNLTTDAALKLAQQKLAELTRYERTFAGTMAGELTLTPRSVVLLAGSGTDFDQPFYISEIERSLSVSRGFIQRVRGTSMDLRSRTDVAANVVASVVAQI
jgi:phage protein D